MSGPRPDPDRGGPVPVPRPPDAPLTPRAAKVLHEAARLAGLHGIPERDGRPVVGVEHLFLAILAEEDGVPVQVLRDEIDLHRAIDLVLQAMTSEQYLRAPRSQPGADRPAPGS
ncbi:Clp protease N-terminal domain-containing protein [Nocardiopsis composta]|uniref:Nucleotide-binding universal stress UspA family protein n=1 Tax=Nocardiopsis composta TaxID=157465 RepID=A0A7W8QJH8_9ACTN|nr:Clp protease N-terminal domain-containing protein [Nocardiopsis composta]MBB5431623.1 nucleotide-binding universal stress UspA family protein [Nocardiopsis composta]